ncbi:MAG TPA: hypothetical protein VGN83_15455 [Falsiroseomonas sp.]|jgi:hypothetical protein|nr:hypothetical protein [Falsiroseomonas sp.]
MDTGAERSSDETRDAVVSVSLAAARIVAAVVALQAASQHLRAALAATHLNKAEEAANLLGIVGEDLDKSHDEAMNGYRQIVATLSRLSSDDA